MAKKKTKRQKPTLMEYDEELSKQFSKGSMIKQCFMNCALLFAYPEKLSFPAERAFYIEGLAVASLPIHHAWIELNGRIVDPTRYVAEDMGLPYHITIYEPKVRLSELEICTALSQERFPVWNHQAEMAKEALKRSPELLDHPDLGKLFRQMSGNAAPEKKT